ncbi:unnamed protein product [Lymnaea stagnalis]|uniref:Uncharacterized protein n=1 Tax=Lymnaea stagnalis TaxID=6523 RepID=A0AAV2I8B5_LYMST
MIPPACCKDKVFMSNDVKERFYNVVYCAETANKTLLNTDGCYKFFFRTYVEPWTSNMFVPFLGVGCLFTVLSGLIPHMPKGDRNNLLDKSHPHVKKFLKS